MEEKSLECQILQKYAKAIFSRLCQVVTCFLFLHFFGLKQKRCPHFAQKMKKIVEDPTTTPNKRLAILEFSGAFLNETKTFRRLN